MQQNPLLFVLIHTTLDWIMRMSLEVIQVSKLTNNLIDMENMKQKTEST